jgi:hypothetical protein
MGIWDNVDIVDSLLLDERDMNIFHNAEHNHEKKLNITSTTNITDQPNMEDDDSTNNPHTP